MHSDSDNILKDMEYFVGSFQGKRILDLGCDLNLEWSCALAQRGAEVVACNLVNLPSKTTIPPGVSFQVSDGRNLNFPENTFDMVFSISVIEHVNGLCDFFSEVLRVLKPGGVAFLDGGANWPSHVGHHIYFKSTDGTDFIYSKNNPLEPWEHLIYPMNDMLLRLQDRGITKRNALEICEWIYKTDKINRMPFSDVFKEAEKVVNTIIYRYSYKDVPLSVLDQFSGIYESVDLSYYGAFFIFIKPQTDQDTENFILLKQTINELPIFRHFRATQRCYGNTFSYPQMAAQLNLYIEKLFREHPVMSKFIPKSAEGCRV